MKELINSFADMLKNAQNGGNYDKSSWCQIPHCWKNLLF